MKSLRDYLPESFGYLPSDSISPISGGHTDRRQLTNDCPFKVNDKVKIDLGNQKYADSVGTVEKIRERTIFVKMKDGTVHKVKEDSVSLDNEPSTEEQAYARSLRNLRSLAGLSNED